MQISGVNVTELKYGCHLHTTPATAKKQHRLVKKGKVCQVDSLAHRIIKKNEQVKLENF